MVKITLLNNVQVFVNDTKDNVIKTLNEGSIALFDKIVKKYNYSLNTINIGEKTVPAYDFVNGKLAINPKLVVSVVSLDEEEVSDDSTHVTTPDELADAIANAEEGATISVDFDIETPLTLDKSVVITSSNGAKIKNSLNITAGDVKISNMTFAAIPSEGTGSGKKTSKGSGITVSGEASVELKGNTFEDLNNFYSDIKIDTPKKVVISGNTFKSGDSYHVIEWGLNVPVTDVVIENNTFENVCTHNTISMYSYEEGANIVIRNNKFAYSGSAFRFSNANNASANITIEGNTYATTDHTAITGEESYGASSTTWAGLTTFEDYTGNQDFSKLNVVYKQNFYAPEGEEKVLVSADTLNTDAQAYLVMTDEKEWEMTMPTVTFA